MSAFLHVIEGHPALFVGPSVLECSCSLIEDIFRPLMSGLRPRLMMTVIKTLVWGGDWSV